jgi:glutaredoxin
MFQRRAAARRAQDDPTQSGGRHLVTLVTRRECHLCADAERLLNRLADELPFDLQQLDVDADPARRDEYSDRVPVILIDGAEHGYWRVEEARFRRAIAR